MKESKKIIVDLTDNKDFNEYIDYLIRSRNYMRKLNIIFSVLLLLLFSLLLLTGCM
jgi:hypothetical protein